MAKAGKTDKPAKAVKPAKAKAPVEAPAPAPAPAQAPAAAAEAEAETETAAEAAEAADISVASASGKPTSKSKSKSKSTAAQPASSAAKGEGEAEKDTTSFSARFSHILDPRLLRGLAHLGHTHPTQVQAAVLPVALGGASAAASTSGSGSGSADDAGEASGSGSGSGSSSGLRDILARARTGTGKTLAYGLPVMQKILDAKKSLAPTDPQYRTPRALILVPTRELAAQVYAQLRTLADACAGAQDALLGAGADGSAQRIEEDEEEDEGPEEGGEGAEGKKGKSKGKGKGKAPSALHSRSTAGACGSGVAGGAHQVPIEVLNIARDDLKPKVLRMLLGAGSGESRGTKGTQAAQPDILISTPSKLLAYLQSMDSRRSAAATAASSSSAGAGAEEGQQEGGGAALNLSNLESLVVDEADFMLAYGHDMLGTSSGEEDAAADQASGSGSAASGFVKYVLQAGWWAKAEAKGGVQRFLISATLNADVRALQGLLLRRPVVLDLKDDPLFASNSVTADGSRAQLAQYVLRLSEVDKFLLLYVILKLRLIRGKTLIFVNSTERGYRLKLFLEQFGITKAAVLNAELPFTSRMRKVEAFNKDAIAVMIATDEHGADADAAQQGGSDDGSEDDDDEEEAEEGDGGKKRKRNAKGEASSKKSKKGKASAAAAAASEYSASRGVDFLQVACVINFDMPTSLTAYTHRVGRTARAGNTGTALSFVVPRDLVGQTTGSLSGKHAKHLCVHTAASDERVWAKVQEAFSAAASGAGGGAGQQIEEWKYDRAQIEAFRYRMEDALRSVTRVAIKEARVKEIKWEMLHSEKLKSYWEENPQDLEYLQAQTADATGGKMLGSGKVQGHLKHVPTYLMPRIAGFKQGKDATNRPMGYVPKHGDRPRGSAGKKGGNKGKAASGKKKQDPLKKFKAGKPKAK